MYYYYYYYYYFIIIIIIIIIIIYLFLIGSSVLGLGHLLGGLQVPLSDFENDKYLP